MPHEVVIISLAGIASGTLIVMGFFAMILLIFRRKRKSSELTDEEGEMLQEIWSGLRKMEDRVTNLETILLRGERERKFEKKI